MGRETGAPGVCAAPEERRGVLSHCLPREGAWSLNWNVLGPSQGPSQGPGQLELDMSSLQPVGRMQPRVAVSAAPTCL